jgi:RNA polymerase sigma-70 factor, ECF subfamily
VDQRSLVQRAQRGDHDAFAVLAGALIGRLGRAARLILRDPELARDAVQESLIGAWRDLPGLRDPDRFDAWVHRLTVRACLRLARRERRRPVEVELPIEDLGHPGDLEREVVQRDALDAALRRLDPERRALVVLHIYVGLTLPEVAGALGIPLGTAKSRLHRSLRELRVSLDATTSGGTPLEPEGQLA